MNVTEVTALLVAILKKIDLDGSIIQLSPPKKNITIAEGYKLHIALPKSNPNARLQLIDIATVNGLSYFESRNGVMIYKSKV